MAYVFMLFMDEDKNPHVVATVVALLLVEQFMFNVERDMSEQGFVCVTQQWERISDE